MSDTKVVHFKDVKHLWDKETRTWSDPNIVYIGRWNKHYGLLQSKWANPCAISKTTSRLMALYEYRQHLAEPRSKHLIEALPELRGKTLVCWCKENGRDVPCHGDVLIELLKKL